MSRLSAFLKWVVVASCITEAEAAKNSLRKDEIEVVSTFKIIKLCEWESGHEESLVLGVYDSPKYFELFFSSAKSEVAKRLFHIPIRIVALDSKSSSDQFVECHVIFCDNKNRKSVQKLVGILGDSPTLLVGSSNDFLESGGMVRFSYSRDQLMFAINERKGNECGIYFRSSLLALASEVIR